MPSLNDLLQYAVPIGAQAAGGLLNRRAAGNATQRFGAGTTAAMDRITQGADQSRRTLADIHGQNQNILQPYRQSGERNLAELDAGVQQGGGLADPFNWTPPDLQNDPIFQRRLKEGQRIINAAGNAGGIRFSTATMKDFADYATGEANDYLAQDYARQEGTFRQNQYDRLNALTGMTNRGFDAARTEVDAGSAYGNNLARLDQTTAAQLADLEQQRAEAEGLGDIAKANSITDTISGILGTVNNVGTARSLADLLKGGATAGAGAAGTVGATAGGAGAASTAGAAGATGAGGGIGGTLGALATNPITWGVAGAVGAGLLWRKSQAHHEANDWVKGFQEPFDADMAQAQTPEEKQNLVVDYLAAMMEFSKKGSDQAEVIRNATRTFRKYYGDPSLYGAA